MNKNQPNKNVSATPDTEEAPKKAGQEIDTDEDTKKRADTDESAGKQAGTDQSTEKREA